MNKYTGLSDFEINVKIADLIGATPYPYGSGGYHSSAVSGMESAIIIKSPHKVGAFDPCNNPADAMPIIIDNKICTAFDVFAEERDGGNWVASPAYGFASERTRSNNLYRAAMELFLLMKDAENEG